MKSGIYKFLLTVFLLFFLILQDNPNPISAASTYYCPAGQYCADIAGGNYDVAIDYWTCTNGTCSGKNTWYTYCTYNNDTSCTQSNDPVRGYYSYQACEDALQDKCLSSTWICKAGASCNPQTGFCGSPVQNRECSTSADCCYSGYWACTSWGYECGAATSIEAGTCCRAGSPPCTPSCPNPPCTATCPAGYSLKSSLNIISEVPACNSTATCTNNDGCGGTKVCNTAACYQIGTCQTNCSLASCNAGETTTPTPTPRPAGCTPRSFSCENTTTCGVDNNCADSTRTCYPIGACQNCTPSTPAGYHIPATGETTNTSLGVECSRDVTCDKLTLCSKADCGDVTNTFYRNERNTSNPASPTAPRMTIDGINFNLSTDPTVVTRIKKPLPTTAENTVNFRITGITVDTDIAYGPFYDYNAENKGVSNAWLDDYDNCDGNYKEDFCYFRDTSTTKEFHSTITGHKTPTQILLEGAEGTVAFRSVSTDRCTSSNKYSTWTFPSYKVNNLPKVTDVLISGNDMYKGCQATAKYTGLNANNPLTITIKGTDADGLADINGAIIWLVKEGSALTNDIDKLTYFTAATPRTDANKIGILVRRDNTNTYVANIVSGALSDWSSSSQSQVVASSGQVLVSAISRTHSPGAGADLGKYIFAISVTFPNPPSGSPLISGKYNVYAALTDGFTYSTYLDQQNVVDSGKDWNFDFVNPSVGTITQVFNDQRNITLTWENSDVGSSPKSNVLNIYKSGISRPVTPAFAPDSTPDPVPNPPTIIGDINPLLSGWYYPTPTNSALINIGNNSNGTITIYPTVYDQACNRSNTSPAPSLELNRWITTKGGVLFSQQDINYIPKSSANQYNLGTELISLSFGYATVLDYGSEQNPTKVLSAIDTNYIGKGTLFEALKERAIFYNNKYNYPVKVPPFPPFPPDKIDFTQCTDEICVFWRDGNLTIGTDNSVTTYSGKRLVFASGNITIYPNVKAIDPAMDGLIILAGGNITITGNNKNTIPASTDEIDALLLANGYISVLEGPDAELDPAIQQDALIITGSMLALGGTNPSRAFDLRRNLGLQNPLSPVLIVNYHPKYAKISELFFGTDNKIYKQEVGYKL